MFFVCHRIEQSFKFQDGSKWFPWWRSCCTVAQMCLRGWMCIFLRWVWCALYKCPGHQCMQVHTSHRCFWHQRAYLRHNRCRVCTCADFCAVHLLALGEEGAGVELVDGQPLALVASGLAWGIIIDDRSVVCVFESPSSSVPYILTPTFSQKSCEFSQKIPIFYEKYPILIERVQLWSILHGSSWHRVLWMYKYINNMLNVWCTDKLSRSCVQCTHIYWLGGSTQCTDT